MTRIGLDVIAPHWTSLIVRLPGGKGPRWIKEALHTSSEGLCH